MFRIPSVPPLSLLTITPWACMHRSLVPELGTRGLRYSLQTSIYRLSPVSQSPQIFALYLPCAPYPLAPGAFCLVSRPWDPRALVSDPRASWAIEARVRWNQCLLLSRRCPSRSCNLSFLMVRTREHHTSTAPFSVPGLPGSLCSVPEPFTAQSAVLRIPAAP